jgi:pilus assembly protein CpaB
MRAVFGLVLIIGVGLAGAAIYMVQGYFEQQNAQLAAQRARMAQNVPTVDVLAVNRVVKYGEEITPEDVVTIKHAKPFLPEGVFRTEEEVFPQGPEETRVALRQMEPNEPLMAVKVTEPGESAGINALLTPGLQAYAIDVTVRSAVSGFLRPGDRVDVYWTGRANLGDRGGATGVTTRLIQSGLTIVAVDQSTDSGRAAASGQVRTVTVEADSAQVAALATAQGSGQLSLALVGDSPPTASNGPVEVNQATLLGISPRQEPEPVEQKEVCTIRQNRGTETVEVEIPCTN